MVITVHMVKGPQHSEHIRVMHVDSTHYNDDLYHIHNFCYTENMVKYIVMIILLLLLLCLPKAMFGIRNTSKAGGGYSRVCSLLELTPHEA